VNLVIGTLYCAKNNYQFGIARVIKSMEPYQTKLGWETWFYCKRCFLALIEGMVRTMSTADFSFATVSLSSILGPAICLLTHNHFSSLALALSANAPCHPRVAVQTHDCARGRCLTGHPAFPGSLRRCFSLHVTVFLSYSIPPFLLAFYTALFQSQCVFCENLPPALSLNQFCPSGNCLIHPSTLGYSQRGRNPSHTLTII